jgi:Ca2+-binding RTX toxin-like protein
MKRLLPLALLLVVVSAAPADAATVEAFGQNFRFLAEPGETNHPIFHYRAEDELVVYDASFPGRPLNAGTGCVQDGDNTVVCPRAGVQAAEFALGDPGEDADVPDSLTLTAAVPVPVAIRADPNAGARVSYIDLRPVAMSLDLQANDGPAGRGDIIGPGVDVLVGGDGSDTIVGNERANGLNGDNGADTIRGGAGNDTITAASYNDVGADAVGLETRGADTVACGSGTDTVYHDSSDTIAEDCERRVLVSDTGFSYEGTARADRIIAALGPALVHGRGGNDRLGATRQVGGVTLFGDSGDDRVAGNAGGDILNGGPGSDLVLGAEGDDQIDGGSGRDRLSGGPGPDAIRARDGSRDTIACGAGRDTVTADRIDRVARDCERVSRR